MRIFRLLAIPTVITCGLIALGMTWLHSGHNHLRGDHVHTSGADVLAGVFTDEELAQLESMEADSALSTKTPPNLADAAGPSGHNDVLTIVIDFKDAGEPITSDVFGFQTGPFDIVEYGFSDQDFDLVTNALLAEVFDDFFDEICGSIGKGEELEINFVIGDIGVAPPGVSEFYYVQVGSVVGAGANFLGLAFGSSVRNENGDPNPDIEIGDVVATVFTDNIQSLSNFNLSPANALSSGNLEFTTNAIVGTLSHEIGHVLSLDHVAVAQSVTPSGAAPILATGPTGLTVQTRLEDRQFSLFGQENGTSRFNIDQLAGAVGLRPILLGDVNRDGVVNFSDIPPFIAALQGGDLVCRADIDQNGVVNFLDISPFILILQAQ